MKSIPADSDSTTAHVPVATPSVRLTQQVKAGGCAAKLPPGMLSSVLARIPQQQHENLIVGFATADDAGVYRMNESQALVQTVDFFTPMVDDPYTFGRIAATNALSDIYAMGGRAVTALSIVCFPPDQDLSLLEQILLGGLSVMEGCGCIVVGGHSVRDQEIKFGYAVTGLIDPGRVFKNSTARPGDALVLGKALGTGVITTALKQGRAQQAWIDGAVASMTASNLLAAEVATRDEFEVHAMTDVTGFGLMGHAREMALGSGVCIAIDTQAVPLLEGAVAAVEGGFIPAGLRANREFAECIVADDSDATIDEAVRALLYDPQTSGGLLIALPESQAAAAVDALRATGYPAARIGRVVEGSPKIVLR